MSLENLERPVEATGFENGVEMIPTNPVARMEKLCRIWSERREQQIAIKVQYDAWDLGGCRLIDLYDVRELE